MTTAKKTTTKPAKAEKTTAAAEPSLQFVHLDMIEALPQVRTVFEDEALAELAESIKAVGMLQPVLLRKNTAGIKFEIIAGERRVRAARLAGLEAVPALVGEVAADRALQMQLVENIQREDLTLAETAVAIKGLYAEHKSQKKVCEILGKSPAWVSKRMAFAHGLGYRTEELLRTGATDDLELLLVMNELEKPVWSGWYTEVRDLFQAVNEGKAGRKEARDLMASLKKKTEDRKAEAKKAEKKRQEQNKQGVLDVAPQEPFHAWSAIRELANDTRAEDFDLNRTMSVYTDEQKTLMLEALQEDHQEGADQQHKTHLQQLRELSAYTRDYYERPEIAAFIIGMCGLTFSLEMVAEECRSLFMTANG